MTANPYSYYYQPHQPFKQSPAESHLEQAKPYRAKQNCSRQDSFLGFSFEENKA